ncbi:Mevalonate kinase [Coemansia sp. RSA 2131]|nr:Mevalonate kinase [Coemansia sp. RSA 2131]
MVAIPHTTEAFVVSAPGKAILFGEHAVVYGKTAVAGSLDMRAYALVTPRSDNHVRLVLPDIGVDELFDTQTLPRLTPNMLEHPGMVEQLMGHISVPSGPGRLAILTFAYLFGSLFVDNCGFTVSVRSLLPVGAGLGSSAAYNVALAAALLRLSGRLPAKNASDVINEWAFAGEQVAHGTPSGIDNSVSTRGGFLEYTKGSEARNLRTTNALRVLVTNTKVPRSTRELVAGVRNARDEHPTVVNLVLDAIHETAVSAVSLFENSSDGVEQRLQDLVRMNHRLLATLGVSHAALERIREITARHNMASKLTGAGGGGCALTLVPSDASDETVEQVQCELRDAGFECYSTVVGGAGVAFTECVAAEPVDKWIVRMSSHRQNSAVPADPFAAVVAAFVALPALAVAKLAP